MTDKYEPQTFEMKVNYAHNKHLIYDSCMRAFIKASELVSEFGEKFAAEAEQGVYYLHKGFLALNESEVGAFGENYTVSSFYHRFGFPEFIEATLNQVKKDKIAEIYEFVVTKLGEEEGDYTYWDILGKYFTSVKNYQNALKYHEKALQRVLEYNKNADEDLKEDMLVIVYRKNIIKTLGHLKDEAKAQGIVDQMLKEDGGQYTKYIMNYALGFHYNASGNTEKAVEKYKEALSNLNVDSYKGFPEELREELDDMKKISEMTGAVAEKEEVYNEVLAADEEEAE